MSTQPTKENNDGNGMSYSKVWAEALRRVKEREDEVAQLIKKREEERREAEEERRWEEDFNRRLREASIKKAKKERERKEKEAKHERDMYLKSLRNHRRFEKVSEEASLIMEEEEIKKKEESRRQFEAQFNSVVQLARDLREKEEAEEERKRKAKGKEPSATQ
jgi:hypothetical protein